MNSSPDRIAIKDPRISLLSSLWQEHLKEAGFTTKSILCLRHPQAVANSLNTRDHFSDLKSYHLWYHYNLALLEQTTEDLLVVSYENLLENPAGELLRISSFLALDGLTSDNETQNQIKHYCESFIDKSLSRSNAGIEERFSNAPNYIGDLYKALKQFDSNGQMTVTDSNNLLKKVPAFDGDKQLSNEILLLSNTLEQKDTCIQRFAQALVKTEEEKNQAIGTRNHTAEANIGLTEANYALKELNQHLHNQNADLLSNVQHQASEVQRHVAVIEQQASDVQRHVTVIKQQASEVEQQASQIQSHVTVIEQQSSQIQSHEQRNKEQSDETHALQETLSQLSHELSQHQQTNLTNQQQLIECHQIIHGFQQSNSWKLTAPLRSWFSTSRNIKLALYNLLQFARQKKPSDIISKSARIWRQEGLLGVKRRLKFGPIAHQIHAPAPAHIINQLPIETNGPSSISLKSNGQYALTKHSVGYTYIPTRKPSDFNEQLANMKTTPLFSVIVPLYNTPLDLLDKMVQSVESQWYPNWQLVLADDASPLPDAREHAKTFNNNAITVLCLEKNQGIAGATNSAIEEATGEFIVLLDHDDELTADCLFELAKCIDQNNPDFIYSDEDKIDEGGGFTQPHFKPDWSPDTMMSTMYTCHVACFRKTLIDEVGGLRPEFDGCQDWDLVLRITEKTNKIQHIPKILYHWRIIPESTASDLSVKPYIIEASQNARRDALKRRGLKGSIEASPHVNGYFSVNYHLQGTPLISVIIPTRDNTQILKQCLDSIFNNSSYKNIEIIILDNGSIDADCLAYFKSLEPHEKITVIRHDAPFNFSELNNIGAEHASGELLLFLNDDTEVITPDWLERMGGYAQLEHIGAVGAKLLYPHGNDIQHAGVVNFQNGPMHAFSRHNADAPAYFMRNLLEYNWLAVTGACLMIDAKKFSTVGKFNENFPVAYNDIELCMQLLNHNLYNIVCQAARLTHHESISRGSDLSPEKAERLQKELQALNEAHPKYAQHDPFHNINLHPNGINFEVAQ